MLLSFRAIPFVSYLVDKEIGRLEIFYHEIPNDRGSAGAGFSVEGAKTPAFLRFLSELPDTLPS